MLTFVALYRGVSLATAKLVAVSIDPAIVGDITRKLLAQQDDADEALLDDAALQALTTGQRQALTAMRSEATHLAHEWSSIGEEDPTAL
jgi:hypothetical protein